MAPEVFHERLFVANVMSLSELALIRLNSCGINLFALYACRRESVSSANTELIPQSRVAATTPPRCAL